MTQFDDEITAAALSVDLDPRIVRALITVESGGNTWAWNPEPKYRYLWDVRSGKPFRALSPGEASSEFPPSDFPCLAGDPDQEWWGQQASFGLMQVMGAVAREMGFKGAYLTQLCEPSINLRYGCQKLAADLKWAGGDVRAMLASYNGGRGGNSPGGILRNAAYADKVLSKTVRV